MNRLLALVCLSSAVLPAGLIAGCGAPPGPSSGSRSSLPTYDKVGVIDVGRVMRETTRGQQIAAQLADAERQVRGRLADLQAELETIAEDLEAVRGAASPDEQRLGELLAEFRSTEEEAERIRTLGEQQLSEYQVELTLPLLEEVEAVCEAIGREEDYGLIVDRTALAFADEAVDLTERIIGEIGGGAASGALIREALRGGADAPGGDMLQLPSSQPGPSLLQLEPLTN